MNIKIKVVAVLALAVFVLPGVTFAQTTTQSVASLQAEINALVAEVQLLEAQLAAQNGTTITTTQTTTTGPTLGIAIDSTTPPAETVVMNSTGNTLGVFRFDNLSSNEDIKVASLTMTDYVAASVTTPLPAFSNVSLWDGSTLVGVAAAPVKGGTAASGATIYSYTFNFATPVSVPQGNSVVLTLKGDAGSYASGITDNASNQFEIVSNSDVTAFGATSNESAVVTATNAFTNLVTVLRTMLSVTGQSVTTMPPLSFQQLGSVNLTANAAGNAIVNSLKLTFGGSAAASAFLNSVVLHDSNGNDIIAVDHLAQASVSGNTITWTFSPKSNPLYVIAGSSYPMTLWGDLSKLPIVANQAQSVIASIQGPTDFSYYDGTNTNAQLVNLSAGQAGPITVVNLSGSGATSITPTYIYVTGINSGETVNAGSILNFGCTISPPGKFDVQEILVPQGNTPLKTAGNGSFYDSSWGGYSIGGYSPSASNPTLSNCAAFGAVTIPNDIPAGSYYLKLFLLPWGALNSGQDAPQYSDSNGGGLAFTVAAPSTTALSLSIANISGIQSSYQPNQSISFTLKGTQLSSGQPATSAGGFNVQAYVSVPGSASYLTWANGSYNSATGLWQVTVPAPSTIGTYNMRVSLYCSQRSICGAQYPAFSTQVDQNTTITVLSSPYGTLDASLDSSSPAAGTVSAGQVGVVFSRIRFAATSGNVNLGQVSAGSSYSGALNYLSNIKVYNGSTLVGSAANLTPEGSVLPAHAEIPLNQEINIPSGGNIVLTYVADVSPSASGMLNLGLGGDLSGNYSGSTNPNQTIVIPGNTMTVAAAISQNPASFSYFGISPSTIASGKMATISFSGTNLSKASMQVTCPSGVTSPDGHGGDSCGRTSQFDPVLGGTNSTQLLFNNSTANSQQVSILLTGYDMSGNPVTAAESGNITVQAATGCTSSSGYSSTNGQSCATPVPTITSITPSTATFGQTITINGTGLAAANEIWFNAIGQSAGMTVSSDGTSVSIVVPIFLGNTCFFNCNIVGHPGTYQVAVSNANGNSNTLPLVVAAVPTISQVQGLTATASGNSVNLSWSPATASAGIGVYAVYRSTTSGFTPTIGGTGSNLIVEGNVLSYTDSGLAAGTYYYVVSAQDTNGTMGPASAQAQATVVSTAQSSASNPDNQTAIIAQSLQNVLSQLSSLLKSL